MKLGSLFGGAIGLASLWPVARGLAAIDAGDYLGAAFGLALAWLLARTAVELVSLGDHDGPGPQR